MKRFKSNSLAGPELLAAILPLLLVVPNALLCFTEGMPFPAAATNILLPAGLYYLWMGCWKKVGVSALLTLPIMILAAFQIVLLYLYGGAIIGVDMFINVVTTNPTEVSELLGNLIYSILLILLLYLPPIISGIVITVKHKFLPPRAKKPLLIVGCSLTLLGTAACVWSNAEVKGYALTNDLFPVNVSANIVKAVQRAKQTLHYEETSATFSFNAYRSADADTTSREIYVMVIGETSRADRWQLLGAKRKTNPKLSQRRRVVAFPYAITQSNTTHKSVPMFMSHLTAENFDSIIHVKSILEAFKEAGFRTAFFSNQQPNRSFTQHFGSQAHRTEYTDVPISGIHPYDSDLLGMLAEEIADTTVRRLFVVLHTYGSHFTYRDRYPDDFSIYVPDKVVDANRSNRQTLLNAYDNTIVYTDHILDSVITMLEASGAKSAMIYSADHGEDIFDDSRDRFLHASPTPTYYQLHVAALAWMSEHPQHDPMLEAMGRNARKMVSPSVALFHTMLQMAGVRTDYYDESASVASGCYVVPEPLYLTDHNIGVPLVQSGLKSLDKPLLLPILTRK